MKRSRKGQVTLGVIVVLALSIIVGLAFLPDIFSRQSEMTTKNAVVDEVVSVATAKIHGNDFNASVDLGPVTNAPSGWKVTDCPLTSIVVSNASGHALTLTTDYTLSTTTGVLNIVNNTDTTTDFDTSNNSLVDYTYCLDGYNKDSGSRGVAGIIGLFSVLAILAFVTIGIKQWMTK